MLHHIRTLLQTPINSFQACRKIIVILHEVLKSVFEQNPPLELTPDGFPVDNSSLLDEKILHLGRLHVEDSWRPNLLLALLVVVNTWWFMIF
ncbi:hypothetical protein GCK72_012345 [Caenorhabditis remanei]|uniref:Uncharacterized protein n=1 Tax=Caenorhabditis remanei TaxID=31234 RepID=A0A6A5GMX7_CAERE|nr:hypothetical protein GCK72_012345 [Caenorhabditis remanei]KAF1755892.1 hypothetical protein GCK72_012345 [Caenorhabditis remanei]